MEKFEKILNTPSGLGDSNAFGSKFATHENLRACDFTFSANSAKDGEGGRHSTIQSEKFLKKFRKNLKFSFDDPIWNLKNESNMKFL